MAEPTPWDTGEQTEPTHNPWQTPSSETDATTTEQSSAWSTANSDEGQPADTSWLNSPDAVVPTAEFSWQQPFAEAQIPFDIWVENGLDWLVDNFRDVFQLVRVPVDMTLTSMDLFLQSLSPWLVIAFFTLLAWQFGGRRLAGGTLVSFLIIGFIGAWSETMLTLSLVLTSVLFSILIGVPLGILMGKSDRAEWFIKPLLDAMQTTPAFVYLVPIVMLFGIGNVPGVVVTIIFALPPLVRLTSLGIRQVPQDLVEASHAFGASMWQMLFKVELPVALPTIMAGINQNLMLSLSMVVIASMIAVGGLGQMVLRGIGRLDMGLAAVGGLAIVLLAIILDRITQSLAQQSSQNRGQKWYQSGPLGWILKGLNRKG
ncbi:proline/glycine betaine ABC transporter permease ProW [Hydrogenovibrio sp. SC-1]|uniref:glycine betaine/L-proline ABC transporter permease ProW n=1 Tax=Hydrogenovibrio sp. SC-1 TaxID=2065820 RepID=UPI000C7C780A|nr:glycine betaine/L-proline ABC transporter permease ProW [Hydrogenovibrio sp. SC-1]PLA74250.1 proline/glycine betaine ABC transporter permease ProW [Hydrogenovibrio sp. SC-1]